jgi:hypothetical protein
VRRHPAADTAGFVRAAGDVEPECLLEGEIGRGLLHEALPHGDEFPGTPLRVLRHVQHRLEVHAGRLAGPERARLELRKTCQRQQELASCVLDLGVQAQGVEVVRPLLENRRDFRLGLRQLAEFDEHASVHQALLILGDRFDHPLYLAPGEVRHEHAVRGTVRRLPPRFAPGDRGGGS